MNNLWKKRLAVGLMSTLVMIGCNKEDTVAPEVTDSPAAQAVEATNDANAKPPLDESRLTFPEDVRLESPLIQEGGETQMFELIDDGVGWDEGEEATTQAWTEGSHPPCQIHGLSGIQKQALKRAHRKYCQCACGIHQAIRQIHHQILSHANAQLRKIIRKLQHGQITPAEFQQQLRRLIQQTRQSLRNNPRKKQLLKTLRQCKIRYARAAHRILNSQQFHQWVKCRKSRHCRCRQTGDNNTTSQ